MLIVVAVYHFHIGIKPHRLLFPSFSLDWSTWQATRLVRYHIIISIHWPCRRLGCWSCRWRGTSGFVLPLERERKGRALLSVRCLRCDQISNSGVSPSFSSLWARSLRWNADRLRSLVAVSQAADSMGSTYQATYLQPNIHLCLVGSEALLWVYAQ